MAVTLRRESVSAIRFGGCGHLNYLPDALIAERKADHKSFYCSTCGYRNFYPGESDVERERRLRTAAEDQRDTLRDECSRTRNQLRAQKGVTTRVKNRVGRGVCPCCNRTFKDLAQHMENQHPEFVESALTWPRNVSTPSWECQPTRHSALGYSSATSSHSSA